MKKQLKKPQIRKQILRIMKMCRYKLLLNPDKNGDTKIKNRFMCESFLCNVHVNEITRKYLPTCQLFLSYVCYRKIYKSFLYYALCRVMCNIVGHGWMYTDWVENTSCCYLMLDEKESNLVLLLKYLYGLLCKWLVGFYSISTLVRYLMPNLLYILLQSG